MFSLFKRRQSLPIRQFLNDKNSVGPDLAGTIRPASSQLLTTVSDNRFTTVVLRGRLGIGKSTIAHVLLLKQLDELLCNKNPQKTLGFQLNAPLHLVVIGPSAVKAKTQAGVLHSQLMRTKNFAKHKPSLIHATNGSMIVFEKKSICISFEPAYSQCLLGLNVVGGVIETDKLTSEQLQRIVPVLADRIKSRTTAANYAIKNNLVVVENDDGEPWKTWADEFAEIQDSHKISQSF